MECERLLTQVLQKPLPMEQVIDNDRQLIAIEEDLFEQLQVFELVLVEVFELEVNKNYVPLVQRLFRLSGSAQ